EPAFAWIPRRQVQRPDAEGERVDLFQEGPLVPDVVAVGDDVGARFVDLAGDLSGESGTAGGVLAVDDHEVDGALARDHGHECPTGLTTALPHHIADE